MGRRTVAIIVAVVLAVAVAALVWWYVTSVRSEVGEGEETQAVLVAREDIPARTTGESIVETGLAETTQVPKRLVAPSAISDENALRGKVLTADVAQGQQLVGTQLGAPEAESVSFTVEKGMRAISVPIDRTRGVAGEITPGDMVDVLATFEYEKVQRANANLSLMFAESESSRILADTDFDPSASQGDITRVLLQQIEVMAIDPMNATETDGGGLTGGVSSQDEPTVTLIVTPEQAEKLVFAQEMGTVWFALIPSGDTQEVTTPGRAVINVFPR